MQDDVKTISHDRMTLIMYIWLDGIQLSSICLVSPPSYPRVWGHGAEHGQMGQAMYRRCHTFKTDQTEVQVKA